MSAEIMEKASELAEAIAESEELAEMRRAELAMNSDTRAVDIIGDFQRVQKKVYDIQMSGGELSEAEKKEVEEVEARMNNNPAIRAYIDASERFEHLMRSVNLIITRAISGDHGGCSCGSDCSTECGPSCGCN